MPFLNQRENDLRNDHSMKVVWPSWDSILAKLCLVNTCMGDTGLGQWTQGRKLRTWAVFRGYESHLFELEFTA